MKNLEPQKSVKCISTNLIKFEKDHKCLDVGACFAVGTLVHTKEGLIPIEKIKVGDWVLSKPESGGEQAYKRVIKTFAHEPQTVTGVCYQHPEIANRRCEIVATPNHPFWVVDQGWTAVAELSEPYPGYVPRFELCNGGNVYIRQNGKIYVSDQLGVGWLPSHLEDPECPGFLWDYVNHKLVASDVFALESVQRGELEDPYLKLPVYNLEVEDFHTYYVGEHGVWVYNTNCGGGEVQ